MALPPQNPRVERHRVVIPNKYDEKLVGILHDAGTTDVVIVCHGMLCSKDTNIILNIAVALENAKISSFRFDFSGNGESEGLFQRNDGWKEVDDLLAVAQHFRESNRNISAIVGHSKGGDIVLLYASKYCDIKKVVNISGRYDLSRAGKLVASFMAMMDNAVPDMPCFVSLCHTLVLITVSLYNQLKTSRVAESLDFCVTEENLMDRLAINMHDECLQIDKECSVLTIHGSSDEVNPVEDAFEFAKIIPNHKLHVIEGADHFFTNHQEDLSSIVVNFTKETSCTKSRVRGTAS